MTEFQFLNEDPEYAAVFWIGTDRYGPFPPWTRTKLYYHETYAGLVFRVEFPKRHNCDQSNAPLSRPLTGQWGIGAFRVYKSRGCAGLSVLGDPVRTFGPMEPWTPDPETPAPTSSAPSPTASATTASPTAEPSGTATP
jgi:hypothetical protein